jgi:hypothetical protein
MDGKRPEIVPVYGVFENFIDRGKTTVVAHLVDQAGAFRSIAKAGGGGKIQRERFFAKDVPACI